MISFNEFIAMILITSSLNWNVAAFNVSLKPRSSWQLRGKCSFLLEIKLAEIAISEFLSN